MAKPFVGSYTILKTYKDTCPHQMFRRYIVKDQPYVETPEMKRGNDIHTAFEHRLRGGKRLPLDMSSWEGFAVPFDGHNLIIEEKLGINVIGKAVDFFASDVWFRGKADVVIAEGGVAYINDWKSGSSKYEDAFELETNAVLLQAKYPDLQKIVGSFTWLKENRLSRVYDVSDTLSTLAEIRDLMAEIDEKKQSGLFEKRQGPLCGWCSVKDCEHWRERK